MLRKSARRSCRRRWERKADEVGGNILLFHTTQGMKMLYLFALNLRSSMMQAQHGRVNEIHGLHSIAYAVVNMTRSDVQAIIKMY